MPEFADVTIMLYGRKYSFKSELLNTLLKHTIIYNANFSCLKSSPPLTIIALIRCDGKCANDDTLR